MLRIGVASRRPLVRQSRHRQALQSPIDSRWYHVIGRRRAVGPSPEQAVYGLIGVNCAVLAGWKLGDGRFMSRHFLASRRALQDGRVHTLLTSAFSHEAVDHFVFNMIALYFFGLQCANIAGGTFFLGLYALGGVSGAAGQIFIDSQRRRRSQILGASSGVSSAVVFSVLCNPRQTIYVNMFLPVPAALFGALYILSDVVGSAQGGSSVGHVAHLSGSAIGAAGWALWRGGFLRHI